HWTFDCRCQIVRSARNLRPVLFKPKACSSLFAPVPDALHQVTHDIQQCLEPWVPNPDVHNVAHNRHLEDDEIRVLLKKLVRSLARVFGMSHEHECTTA